MPLPAARPCRGDPLSAFTPADSAALGGPGWLVERRAAVASRLDGLVMPSESEEIWRYSGIDDFDLGAFAPATGADGASSVAFARVLADRLGRRAALVVSRQGSVLAVELEPGAPAELVAVMGAGAPAGDRPAPEAPPAALERFDSEPDDAFDVLHDAFLRHLVVVTVADGQSVLAPVVVVHLVDGAGSQPVAPACFPRTFVRVGRRASGGVVEVLAPAEDRPGGPALVVPRSELEVAEEGQLSYANLQVLGEEATCIGTQRSRVGAGGTLRSFTVGLGGRYARVRTDSDLVGKGAQSALLAAYLGTGAQVHDFRTLQDHHAERTGSELLFTGAVADTARSVYSGLIRIRRGAKRADARQTNHNLVLSEGAHADSVPNLDIDENDVRCSHASTVGPIDEDQRYYLESRGIEPATAERLIVLGFFSDLAARCPFPSVGDWVAQAVVERLAGRLPAEKSADDGEGGGVSDG